MFYYALYSKSQKRYCAPFLALDDSDSVTSVSNMVTSQQDPVLIMSLDDLRLEKVGRFAPDEKNPVNTVEVDTVLDDLHVTLPLPPLVKEKVDLLYKAKEVENE